jgi:hypothetical protein
VEVLPMANKPRQENGDPVRELSADQALAMFKFYEEAAERTKAHAWAQTTWILTLNAGFWRFLSPATFAADLRSSSPSRDRCGGAVLSGFDFLSTNRELHPPLLDTSDKIAQPGPAGAWREGGEQT